MLEGTRLKYIIPGYTGHIPKKEEFDTNPAQKKEAHIPGYDGKVKSIKSENMYGQTFGKITGTVAKDEQIKGQEISNEFRYLTQSSDIYRNQALVEQRKVTEIVGLEAQPFKYQKPLDFKAVNEFFGEPTTEQQVKGNQQVFYGPPIEEQDIEQQNSLKLGTPLPGYTGHMRRVEASNIFGQTFANSIISAGHDQETIVNKRTTNLSTLSNQIPNITK